MTELQSLEEKLTLLVGLHQRGRDENRDLRVRVAQLEAENRALADKVKTARERVEALIERLPVDQET